MIARIWRGWTRTWDADDYATHLQEVELAVSTAGVGNRGAYLLRRGEDDRTHFMLVSFWDSLHSLRNWAGDDLETVVLDAVDRRYLIGPDPTVCHFQVSPPRPDGTNP